MKIFNSLTNKLEDFVPIHEGKINMYVCGPTVYNYAHVGNMRPVIVFDVIYRYLKYKGFDIKYASNFTDVDDKIINAALELNTTEKEITEKFIGIYLEDIKSFNCLDVDYRPKVTENIETIIDFISLLLEKDYAYKNGEDVYFRVNKIENYGSLSNRKLEDQEIGSRIEVDENKENPYDFVLWKKTDKGITWDAPFGNGRPGWHTECVVMINNIFKGKIDIHGGGNDLLFPHHENEIAQSCAAWDHSLANFWMHNGMIKVNGDKMSKSLNNFILARELRSKYDGNIIRIGFLKTHYRMPLDLTDTLFEESKTIDEKVKNALKTANLFFQINNISIEKNIKDPELEKHMDDDFNTSNTITYLLELVKRLNASLKSNDPDSKTHYEKICTVNEVLGLVYETKELTEEEKEIYQKWITLREEKNFEEADKLRNLLTEKNIL